MTSTLDLKEAPSAPALAFAAEVTLALAATLNLRRTLGRTLSLAVPRLADWAYAGVTDGLRVLRMHVAHDEAPVVDEDAARAARRPVPGPGSGVAREVPHLTALGVPDALAAEVLDAAGAVEWVQLPLVARGTPRGLLVLMRPESEPLDDDQRRMLQMLAERGALALDAALVYEQLNALATTLRAALLPPVVPDVPGVRLGTRYRAAVETTQIGGDFFDFHRSQSGHWCVALGDVCGKGVGAAVLTGQVRQSLRVASVTHDDPADVLDVLNQSMLLSGSASFVTVVWARLEPRDDGLDVVLADGGHPPPLVLRADGRVEEVGPTGTLVGLLPEARVPTVRVGLDPGDTLLLYTDGVTEARGPDGTLLGEARLRALLADCVGMTSQSIGERIEQAAMEHLRGRSHDDIAVLAIQPDPEGAA
ncbi:MAG: PP2C family protein-serine/threonine phosphatase [Angustibacter sp.]